MSISLFSQKTMQYGAWLGELKRCDSRFQSYLQSPHVNHGYLRLLKIGFERQPTPLSNRCQAFVIRQLEPHTLLAYLFGHAANFVALASSQSQPSSTPVVELAPAAASFSHRSGITGER